MIEKAKAAKSPKEIFDLAKENNVEMTEEEAKTYFAQLGAIGAVADDELEAVSGGFICKSEDDSEADATDSELKENVGNDKNVTRFV